jgi:hypothetical protein
MTANIIREPSAVRWNLHPPWQSDDGRVTSPATAVAFGLPEATEYS